ncbi:hypothetical protein ACFL1T_04130 [Chlamydiota bacterium]
MEIKKGFSYIVSKEKIKEYSSWPIAKRLEWLYMGNVLRKNLPREIIEKQDKFRKAEI